MRKSSFAIPEPTVQAIDALADMWQQVDTIRTKVRGDYLLSQPANSFTFQEYCDRFSLPRSTANGQLRKMVNRRLLTRHQCLMPDASGRVVPQVIFVLVSNAESASA